MDWDWTVARQHVPLHTSLPLCVGLHVTAHQLPCITCIHQYGSIYCATSETGLCRRLLW